MIDIYVGSRYKVTSIEKYSYIDTETSTYDDVDFREEVTKNVSIYDGSTILSMIAEYFKDNDLINFSIEDGHKMKFEYYNPSGETSDLVLEFEVND